MSYIKKEKIEEIKEKADIVSVVSDYVSLKKSGRYFMGNCPFHSEKTPSFFLYPETDTFHCFGCGKHGDSISFVMEMESLDYVSTLKKLAEKLKDGSIKIPTSKDGRTLNVKSIKESEVK